MTDEPKKMGFWKRMTTPVGVQIAGGGETHPTDYGCRFGFLGNGTLYNLAGAKPFARYPVAGATAVFDDASEPARMALSRIVGGGLLFGPAGAILGGMWKKQKGKVYMHVRLADGNGFIVEGPIKYAHDLSTFAYRINEASAIFAAAESSHPEQG